MTRERFSGDLLRHFREEAGLSRRDVATATARTPWSVVNWELGRSRPSLDAVERVAVLLQRRVGDLFEVEEAEDVAV